MTDSSATTPIQSAAERVRAALAITVVEAKEAPPPEQGSMKALYLEALAEVKAALAAPEALDDMQPLFTPLSELFNCDYPPTSWLVRGLVVEGGVTIVGGLPKEAFKTWFLIEMATAIATGTPAFGVFETGAPKVVAYFFAEDIKRAVRNRFRGAAKGRGMTPEQVFPNLHVQPRGRFLDVLRDEDMALIIASCRLIGKVDVLILEPLRDLHSGEEDKSDSMRNVMRRLRLLGGLLKCTPMVAHHSGKPGADSKSRGGGQKMRGSGSIHGSVDNGIYLEPIESDGVSTFKNNVESQIKSARSAGYFDLELCIEDDIDGEATCATWTYEKTEKPGKRGRKAQGVAQRESVERERWELVRALAEVDTETSPAGFVSSAAVAKRLGMGSSAAAYLLRGFAERGLLEKDTRNRGYRVIGGAS